MNIFFLDSDPKKAAQFHCDIHCNKMILEICQQFCTNFHLQDIKAPYKKTHINHPSTIWSRLSKSNFEWLIEHCQELCKEKIQRFGSKHKSEEVLNWVIENYQYLSFPKKELTKFSIAISNNTNCRKHPNFNQDNPVQAYRLYYKLDKNHIAKWKTENIPYWWK
ncbi:hypothetical protein V6O07_04925 [Arthrospira platensis SPKY2]